MIRPPFLTTSSTLYSLRACAHIFFRLLRNTVQFFHFPLSLSSRRSFSMPLHAGDGIFALRSRSRRRRYSYIANTGLVSLLALRACDDFYFPRRSQPNRCCVCCCAHAMRFSGRESRGREPDEIVSPLRRMCARARDMLSRKNYLKAARTDVRTDMYTLRCSECV